jgi:hypothetical protein
MADAKFTINADTSNQGFDATVAQVLSLRLKTLPVSGVSSVSFQVWDPTAFEASLGPDRNPPRASKGAPLLTLVGSTSGRNVSPGAVDGTVSVTMPGTDGHSWIVRCVVNGGMRTLNGRSVFDATLVHERMIVIRDTDGNRPVIATETTQYEDDGWAPSVGKGEPGDDAPIGADNDTGYLARYVFVNPASTRLSTSHLGVTCQATTTWTTAAQIPQGNLFDVQVAGAGGGGAGGGTTEGGSGPGGGGGARRRRWFSRAELISMLPIVLTAGLGGTRGLGSNTNNLVQIVTATNGGNGTGSSLGSFTSGGGSGGQVSNTGRHGGLGGGIADAAAPSTANTAQLGGAPAVTAGVGGTYLEGAGHPSTSGSGVAGLPAVYGGASGGSAAAGAEGSNPGGRAVYGGGAGGSGRSTDLTAGGGNAGADGGGRWTTSATTGGGGIGGPGTVADNVAPAPGGNGADGTFETNGEGGGGGGSNDGNPTTFIAGTGGNGGFPGGAGGGGGATRIRTFAARVCISGSGGLGADGAIIIDAYR